MKKTLTSPAEVIFYAKMPSNFPPCDLRVGKVERNEFRDCLGWAFYKQLIENLADYSTAECWSTTETYAAGTVVVFEQPVWGNTYFRAKVDTTQMPTQSDHWELAPKFIDDCYNELWCDYLAEYLAFAILKNRAPYIQTRINPSGFHKVHSEKHVPLSEKEFQGLLVAIDTDISLSFEDLDAFMKENNANSCYSLYKGISGECCTGCGCTEKECECDKKDCLTIKKWKNRIIVA